MKEIRAVFLDIDNTMTSEKDGRLVESCRLACRLLSIRFSFSGSASACLNLSASCGFIPAIARSNLPSSSCFRSVSGGMPSFCPTIFSMDCSCALFCGLSIRELLSKKH